jgi:DNA-binding response OmpR family regulator
MTMKESPLILIAEDEPDFAGLVQFHLERQGYRTAVAGNGSVALRLAFERSPSLVILDLMLPELHGLTVCRIFRSSRWLQTVPILILSALTTPVTRELSFTCGATAFLSKPVALADLLARVKELLSYPTPSPTAPRRPSPVASEVLP